MKFAILVTTDAGFGRTTTEWSQDYTAESVDDAVRQHLDTCDAPWSHHAVTQWYDNNGHEAHGVINVDGKDFFIDVCDIDYDDCGNIKKEWTVRDAEIAVLDDANILTGNETDAELDAAIAAAREHDELTVNKGRSGRDIAWYMPIKDNPRSHARYVDNGEELTEQQIEQECC